MNKRNTKQKQIVLDTVNKLGCHATADQIYQEIHKEFPNISKGTVYRNLSSLNEDKKIMKIEIPGEVARFDHITTGHYHAKCIKCGRIFDLDMDYDNNLHKAVKNNSDFMFFDHTIVFNCLCKDCKNK